MAQLVEQMILTPKIRGSSPVIEFFNFNQLYCKDKNKEKELGNGPIFFKKTFE